MSFSLIVLAAGEGKRMKSEKSKVVFEVCGREMVNRVIDEAMAAGAKDVCVVVGHRADLVKKAVGDRAEFVTQSEQLGTGHAVMQAMDFIKKSENVMILAGDTPLITRETLREAVDMHLESKNACTVLTAVMDNPFGYGRIIRDGSGNVEKIVEQKDATEEERSVKEINSGMYCFDSKVLESALGKIDNNNAQGEYYLTDTLQIIKEEGLKVGAYVVSESAEISGVNDRVQLEAASKVMRRRINEKLARSGVTIIDIDNTYIEDDVSIGKDSTIYPGAFIQKGSVIGKNTVIGGGSRIVKSVIGDGCEVYNSTVIGANVGDGEKIGPYQSIICEKA